MVVSETVGVFLETASLVDDGIVRQFEGLLRKRVMLLQDATHQSFSASL